MTDAKQKRQLALFESALDADADQDDEIHGVPRDRLPEALRSRILWGALSPHTNAETRESALIAWATLQVADAIDALRAAITPPPRRP